MKTRKFEELSPDKQDSILSRAMDDINSLSDDEILMLRGLYPEQINSCQGCSLCCVAPAIEGKHIRKDELSKLAPKPAGEACRHCVADSCSIYEERPLICQDYLCAYALGEAKVNPQVAGVAWTYQVVEMEEGREEVMVVGHCMDVDKVLRNPLNWPDIEGFFSMGVRAVSVRSPVKVVQLFMGIGIDSIMTDVDQEDPMRMRVLLGTERRSPYQIKELFPV